MRLNTKVNWKRDDAEGVKLASQSATQIAKASKKLSKGVSKINAQSGKLKSKTQS